MEKEFDGTGYTYERALPQREKENAKSPLYKSIFFIALIFGIIFIIGGISNFFTGYVSSYQILSYGQEADIYTESSESYKITLDMHPEAFELVYFKINGEMSDGPGDDVKVYLKSENSKLLISSSEKKGAVLSGYAVKEGEESEKEEKKEEKSEEKEEKKEKSEEDQQSKEEQKKEDKSMLPLPLKTGL